MRAASGTSSSPAVQRSGTIHVFQSDVVSFLSTQTITFTVGTGKRFYVNEFYVVCTTLSGAITTQPTIRLGITGTVAKYLAAQVTTLLTAANKREYFNSFLQDDGEADIVAGVSVAATGPTTYEGRLTVVGYLV